MIHFRYLFNSCLRNIYMVKSQFLLKKSLDILLACIALCLLTVPMVVTALLVKLTSKGAVLYWSDRVGQYNHLFKMPKFRSMLLNTPAVATHLLENPEHYLTPIGSFLRKTSLDELPQLWCILRGDMSIVGPRPALFNQQDLIDLRTLHQVHTLVPGLTGWAQIHGRDALSIEEKVSFDTYYLQHHSLFLDIRIIWKTILQVWRSEGITH